MKALKLLSILTISVLLVLSANACNFVIEKIKGNGKIITKEIKIDDYDKIEIVGGLEFNYSQSDKEPYLQIKIDENILDYIDIYVKNKTLIIEPKKDFDSPINIQPTTFVVNSNSTALTNLEKAGSGKFNILSNLSSDILTFNIAGSGDIICKQAININKLNISIAGSSNSYLIGKVNNASIDIAGSASVEAFNCNIDSLKCEIAGSGNINVSVKDYLSCSIAGSGKIRYKGDPKFVERNISGSGKIVNEQ